MKSALADRLLALYGRAAGGRFFDRPRARRGFEWAYLLYKRLLEAGPLDDLRAVVRPGTVVVDVGANIGFFAERFGRWVGPGGRVVAIEPEARNVRSLRARVQAAGLTGVVECLEAAASDVAGTVHLAVNPRHPGDHHLAATGRPVRAVTLDELLENEPRRVSLLKLDVQGAERAVLLGAARTIERHRPAIFVELDEDALLRQGSSSRAIVETLVAYGYEGRLPAGRGVLPSAALDPERIVALSARDYVDILFSAPSASVTAGTSAGR